MGKTFKSGYLQNLIAYDANGNITLPGTLTISGNALVATQSYVSTQLASLVGSAPGALDTLNELATALGNDAAFATSVTNSIASKLSLSGGTLTGALSGTSATFSGSVIVGTTALLNFGPTSSFVGMSGNNSTGALQLYANNTQVLGFAATTGAATFASTVSATQFNSTSSSASLPGFGVSSGNGMYNGGTNILNFSTNSALALSISASQAATFSSSVTASSIHTTGTLNGASLNISSTESIFRIASNYTGGGDLVSGTLMYIDDAVNNNLTIIPSSAGTSGSKIVAAAYTPGAWKSMWEFANVSSGNPNLVLVKNGGNVGIGITNPQSQLHINGDLTFSESGYNTVRLHQIGHSHSNGSAINNFIRFLVSDGNGNGNTIERMRINGNGGVGINTTTFVDPVFKLQVGDGSADTRALFNSNNAYAISIRNGASSLWYLGVNAQTQTNGFQIFSNQGGIAMTLTTSNNVGINTGSPTQKLTVEGLRGQPGTTGTTQNGLFRLSTLGSGYGEVLDMGVHVGVDGPASYSWIQSTNQGSLAVNYNLVLNPNGGNVGIGTTAPGYKLDVYDGSSVLIGKFAGNQGSATALQLLNSTKSLTIYNCGTTAFGIGEWVSNSVLESDTGLAYSAYNGPQIFMTGVNGRNERMRITSGGSVLIGTTTRSYSESLIVKGSSSSMGMVRFENNVNQGDVNHGTIMVVNTANYAIGNDASIAFALQNGANSFTDPRASIGCKTESYFGGALVFNTRLDGGSYTEKMRITGSGRLGLGVSSPDARLHVGGAILVSNSSQTYRRAITCYGQSGTFTQVKVKFNKTNWGSVTYDIKLGSAGGSYHTAGAYYSNPGFSSHVNSINAGNGPSMSLVAEDSNGGTQGATWTFYGATMIHPIVTVDIACGNGYQVNPDDITVQFT